MCFPYRLGGGCTDRYNLPPKSDEYEASVPLTGVGATWLAVVCTFIRPRYTCSILAKPSCFIDTLRLPAQPLLF